MKKGRAFGLWFFLLAILICARVSLSARSEKEIRERFYGNLYNSSAPESNDGSIAKMFDRVLEKEFSENDQPEGLNFFDIILFWRYIRFLIIWEAFFLNFLF